MIASSELLLGIFLFLEPHSVAREDFATITSEINLLHVSSTLVPITKILCIRNVILLPSQNSTEVYTNW